MTFYELTYPRYENDSEDLTEDPAQPIQNLSLPGLICPACGETWGGCRRPYLPVSSPTLSKRLGGKPLPEKEWRDLASAVRKSASLGEDYYLEPGDVLGSPLVELRAAAVPDFMHPFPGQLIVRGRVVDALCEAGLTGFRPLRVAVRWAKSVRVRAAEPPQLFELIITGHAWRIGMDLERIIACPRCRRTVFPDPERIVVDERRWDGSDFFTVDRNPNIVLVTERVCETIIRNRFTNVACVPVG